MPTSRVLSTMFTAALVAAAMLPAAAHAATASMRSGFLDVRAAPGEVNRLTVEAHDPQTMTVVDTGAPLTASGACSSVDAHRATCAVSGPIGVGGDVRIDLGDRADAARVIAPTAAQLTGLQLLGGRGDDRLDVSRATVLAAESDFPTDLSVRGGPGDDRIAGATSGRLPDGGDHLYGDAGDDTIRGGSDQDDIDGGPGTDTLSGGGGNDRIEGGSGSDAIAGGAGTDATLYLQHEHGVRVDLATGREVGHHERDRLTGIENVVGSNRPDVLRGDGGPNVLYGSDGLGRATAGDVLVGRGGPDHLAAYRPRLVSGGAGDDDLEIYGARKGTVSCGPGTDTVKVLSFRPEDCETVVTAVRPLG